MAAPFYNRRSRFKSEDLENVDYKDVKFLQRFINSYGKIESRKRNGVSLKQQRKISVAIKRARHLALLPFVVK